MRWTHCFALMTLSLGSTLVYTVATARDLRSSFGDTAAFNSFSTEPADAVVMLPPNHGQPIKAPAAAARMAAVTRTLDHVEPAISLPTTAQAAYPETPSVTAGMTGDQVRAALGEPDSISDSGQRWEYGSNVLIFNGENRLAGHVAYDATQAAINRHMHLLASATKARQTEANVAGPGPKIFNSSPRPYARHNHHRFSVVNAASSRDAYRYGRNNQEYSYYMNRYGPLDRVFVRKPALPRGMTTVHSRNVGRAYLPFGNTTRYGSGANRSTQYRR